MHRRTGIPVTTLRFYEKELPDFFHVEKTAGGHRRYPESAVGQFQMVRRLVEQEGLKLGDLREKLTPTGEMGEMRKHLDLLLTVYEALTAEVEQLRVRVESLEIELVVQRRQAAQAQGPAARKKKWF